MLINRRYPYRAVDRVTRPDGVRYYVCPETGLALPSVTTILDATKDKTGLNEWREFVGAEKADRIRDEAGKLGSLMHTHIECHVMGIDRPGGTNLVRVQAQRMADQIIAKGLPNVDEVWGQEVALYMPGLYAGTTDLVGLYDGQEAIMDHKTTRKMKTRDMIDDYFAQLGAYALAHDELFGTTVTIGIIFMVARDFSYQRFVLTKSQLEIHKRRFLDRLTVYMDKNGVPQPLAEGLSAAPGA